MATTRSRTKSTAKAKQSIRPPSSPLDKVKPKPRGRPARATGNVQRSSATRDAISAATARADMSRRIATAGKLRTALSSFRGMLTKTKVGRLVDDPLIKNVQFFTKRAMGALATLMTDQ
ncbi:hypothetical protein LTR85_006006 [Meristemomyces frigidus]|nr:hypothetical protein LTR85_006006 [Meristemomyces frigidus]